MPDGNYIFRKSLPTTEEVEARMSEFGVEVDAARHQAAIRFTQVAFRFRAVMEALVAADGHSIGRMQVGCFLLNNDHRARPSEIAEELGVSTATITGVVDTMEKQGLVRREPHPTDRRCKDVVLTPEGRGVLAFMAPKMAHRTATMFAGVDSDALPQFRYALDRLDEGLTLLVETELQGK